MSKRFGGKRIRTYLAILSLTLYIFTKISVNLYSGAIFIQQAVQWNLYIAVLLLLAMTGICTVTGGLAAVIYTDTLQCLVMIVGAVIVAVKAFVEVGGYDGLREKYMEAIPTKLIPNATCGIPKSNSWQMLRPYNDPEMPWLGFLLGQTPASIWYWCADQMMVQRMLAAKSLSHAQGGTLFAGYLKIFPLFIIVMPGMISRVLYTDEVGCVDPKECYKYCQNEVSCSNTAYPRLVLEIMPSGLRGLMMAVMIAALMSDLTSIFNSASTLFTMDIWPQIRKKATVKELMIVGRVFVIIMIGVSIVWIPVIQAMQGGQLFIYIQAISAYLAPPIAAVYVFAILWKRMNEKAAFWALLLGFMVGVTRMILDFVYPEPPCGKPETRPFILYKVHYMYFAMLLFWLTGIISMVISYMSEPPESFRLIRTTFWTRYNTQDRFDDKENMEMKRAEELKHKIADESKEEKEYPKERISKLKRFYNWFCGYNTSPEGEKSEEEFYEHLSNIASLKQERHEKVILYIFLLFVLSTAIVMFLYFSIP
ncbi:sodium/myo-inositol cotransporter-like isoform X1 [Centruroides sculpturatus]|uniref:sodium/myo-inositol cotransporter-like isoform X1 n=3 Tax=Centruroides sculpturatus TaxID=218467 RepID=UPI000C6D22F9|nr:sodium/myo-inositol cotransporter-like isoform X1 [Centruroides sculpturatus]